MKVTEEQIKQAIDSSLSMAEAATKLPQINKKTFATYAKKLGLYNPNPSGKGMKKPKPKIDLDYILAGNHPQYHTNRLKQRLIEERGWKHECSNCKLSAWMDDSIPLELDHIDGNPCNHQENNLRLLCPNCHALTPTYRNKKRYP